ncbi:unnamed protein product [Pedinophyceae sp. YPF-701]|nr:unnamed protein product [Pedinophyceae sp. YPF-701]
MHPEEFPEGEFNKVADHTLEQLDEDIEIFVEEHGGDDCDVNFGQGVLTVNLGSRGTYVLNKQGPNRQIWTSSPVSGPLRFDYAGNGRWVYARDGRELHALLETELSDAFGVRLELQR